MTGKWDTSEMSQPIQNETIIANADILITGTSGQVGGALQRLFPAALMPGRDMLDLANEASIREYIRVAQPRWILNPGAYTAVDKAESEPALAKAINEDAPRILGEEAARIGARMIHFSTDYVFDGSGDTPWREDDATGPLGVYGATKLAGEQALAATGAQHIILRTSWVFSATGKNFLLTILRLARVREHLSIVADQYGAPTTADDLAALTAHIVALDPDLIRVGGTYHATSQGETTWHGFASEIVRLQALAEPATPLANILPIPTSGFPTAAQRPLNSRLNCEKLASTFAFRLPPWQEALATTFAQL